MQDRAASAQNLREKRGVRGYVPDPPRAAGGRIENLRANVSAERHGPGLVLELRPLALRQAQAERRRRLLIVLWHDLVLKLV